MTSQDDIANIDKMLEASSKKRAECCENSVEVIKARQSEY